VQIDPTFAHISVKTPQENKRSDGPLVVPIEADSPARPQE
jgi:hypothetical protein